MGAALVTIKSRRYYRLPNRFPIESKPQHGECEDIVKIRAAANDMLISNHPHLQSSLPVSLQPGQQFTVITKIYLRKITMGLFKDGTHVTSRGQCSFI